jgi:hypothetical protein
LRYFHLIFAFLLQRTQDQTDTTTQQSSNLKVQRTGLVQNAAIVAAPVRATALPFTAAINSIIAPAKVVVPALAIVSSLLAKSAVAVGMPQSQSLSKHLIVPRISSYFPESERQPSVPVLANV